MNLHELNPAEGSRQPRTRIGRGQGSGRGGTATKGHKGHQSRAGYHEKPGFEGGQMPLQRRLPKFGFRNPFRVEYAILNLSRLQEVVDTYPELAGQELTPALLYQHKVISTRKAPIKVLGQGELKGAIRITAHKFSASAKEAIEKAGGTATLVTPA